jgi:hypothetical protein
MRMNPLTDLMEEKKVSSPVRPSTFGCKAWTRFFLCCLGASLLSISLELPCGFEAVASSVFSECFLAGFPSRFREPELV